MKTAELQRLIDGCAAPADMTAIARSYLEGTVIRDMVAAEAWLMKAIAADDPVHSPLAMGILTREILGKDRVIPEQEIPVLRSRLKNAVGREREELEALLKLV